MMSFGHLNHCIDQGAGINAGDAVAEKPVFPTDCERADRILSALSLYQHKALKERSGASRPAAKTG